MDKRYPFKLYIRHPYTKILLIITVVLNLLVWLSIALFIKPQDDPIFLHYNVLFGVDYLGLWWKILFLPLTGIMITLVNGVLGWLLFSKDKFVAHLLNTISVLSHIFILVATALLIFLNI
jgi:hypothetical protein